MIRNMIVTALALILPAVFYQLPVRAEQTCKETIIATTKDSNFTLKGDGTATDKTTGLMWMRCSLGQEWTGETCGGKAATFTWADGLKAAAGHKFAGHADWRLPNKNELESIVEGRCFLPAINFSVFPATPAAYYWSSSPYAGHATGAWSVDFGYGTVNATIKSGTLHVRLVRDEE
jgi:hypothetical protein